MLVTGGAGFVGSHIVDALRAAGHGRPRRSTRGPRAATSATPMRSSARSTASTHVCHQAGDGRAGGRLPRRRRLRRRTTTSAPRCSCGRSRAGASAGGSCWRRAWSSTARAATAAPTHGPVRPRAAPRRRPRRRPVRAALPALRRARWRPRRSARTRRPTRATCTRRRSSTRSISPPPSRARPACRSPRCATTTSTGRGCRATPRTPASRRSSPARWPPGARRGSSRTAASCATSSTCATSRAPTSLALLAPEPAPGAFNVCSRHAAQRRRDGARAARRASATRAPPVEVTGEYRLGDVRHVFASAALAADGLGFIAQEDFATGMAELADEHRMNPARETASARRAAATLGT